MGSSLIFVRNGTPKIFCGQPPGQKPVLPLPLKTGAPYEDEELKMKRMVGELRSFAVWMIVLLLDEQQVQREAKGSFLSIHLSSFP